MLDPLLRIKRAVLSGRFGFSSKARLEMECDRLTRFDIAECILTAVAITKTIRSRSRRSTKRAERMYVIVGTNLEGVPIYTKGKFVLEAETEKYYFLISSKRSVSQ